MPEPDRNDVRNSDSRRLAKLIEDGVNTREIWQPEELAAVFRHQMSSPVEFDLTNMMPGKRADIATLTASRGLLLRSFADLLHHPNPPLDLLRLAKDFAKRHREHPEGLLPPPIATVLYFASVVVARMRCGRRITELDDKTLQRGLAWGIEQPWVDDRIRDLLEEGQRFLAGGGT